MCCVRESIFSEDPSVGETLYHSISLARYLMCSASSSTNSWNDSFVITSPIFFRMTASSLRSIKMVIALWYVPIFVGSLYILVVSSEIDVSVVLFFFSSRRRHTISVSAFLLNRSSDLNSRERSGVLRVANCDGHTVTIRPRILQAI